MSRLKGTSVFGSAVLACAALLSACSRQPEIPAGAENPAADQSLPFDGASQKSGVSPTRKLVPTSIASGTAITVRLQTPVSSASSASGDFFDAVLDESLGSDGKTIVRRGAFVRGKVVGAKASENLQDPGYLRLTLTRISINGKSYPLQTASIFVKGGTHEKRKLALIAGGASGGAPIDAAGAGHKGALVGAAAETDSTYATNKQDVSFAAERRLTFSLSQPLSLEH
jgi:hypothetical protein